MVYNRANPNAVKDIPNEIKRNVELERLRLESMAGPAFIIGNGESRLGFDLNRLLNKGKTFGCNALYRDYQPDFLIAVDNMMITEIIQCYNTTKSQELKDYLHKAFWPRHLPKEQQWHKTLPPMRGWASGSTSMLFAMETLSFKELYLIGHDIAGKQTLVNNVYAGSQNYAKKDDKETFYMNWVRQIVVLLEDFPDVNIIRVQNKEGFIPEEFNTYRNIKHITYAEFDRVL